MSTGTPILWILLLVAACLVLLVIGLALHRRGSLRSRGAAIGWAILTIAPLFGAGLLLYGHHQIEMMQGTQNSDQVPSSGPSTH